MAYFEPGNIVGTTLQVKFSNKVPALKTSKLVRILFYKYHDGDEHRDLRSTDQSKYNSQVFCRKQTQLTLEDRKGEGHKRWG